MGLVISSLTKTSPSCTLRQLWDPRITAVALSAIFQCPKLIPLLHQAEIFLEGNPAFLLQKVSKRSTCFHIVPLGERLLGIKNKPSTSRSGRVGLVEQNF